MAAYSFLSCSASISGPGGSFQVGNGAGVAEEGISWEMTEEKNTMTVGADGQVMHSLHAGNSGKITIRLLKTSPVNALLSALYNFQKSSPAVWGQNVILASDVYRGDVLSAVQVAFERQPSVVFAKDGNTNEWTFLAGIIDEQLGTGVPDVNV